MVEERSVSIVRHQKRKTNLHDRGMGFRIFRHQERKTNLDDHGAGFCLRTEIEERQERERWDKKVKTTITHAALDPSLGCGADRCGGGGGSSGSGGGGGSSGGSGSGGGG